MTALPRLLSLLRHSKFGGAIGTIKFFFLAHFLTTHVGRFALTDGPSMLPTLNVRGDWVYIDHTFRRGRGVKVGDMVDYHHPLIQGVGGIKRVMGMPGDFVVKDGGEGRGKMMIQVPDGHCWILGDNLPESRDSRMYGPIPLALIKGKVIARVSPWSDMGWMRNSPQRPEEP